MSVSTNSPSLTFPCRESEAKLGLSHDWHRSPQSCRCRPAQGCHGDGSVPRRHPAEEDNDMERLLLGDVSESHEQSRATAMNCTA